MNHIKRYPPFNTTAAVKKSRLLPFKARPSPFFACGHCSFINLIFYKYCTNCGYPLMHNKDRMALYNHRLKDRKQLIRKAESTVQQARSMLYIMAGVCLVVMFFFLKEGRRGMLTGIVLTVIALLFAGLGRWSTKKPFISLLTSFLVLITFIALNAWAEFMNLFTASYGLYMLMVQAVCFIFLFRGLQAAFRVDILEDEFKI